MAHQGGPRTDNPGTDETIVLPSEDADFMPLVEITRVHRNSKYREDTKHLALHMRYFLWWQDKYDTYKPFFRPSLRGFLSRLYALFPLLETLRRYPDGWRTKATNDLVCGLSITTLLIPQVISYANVAGLPAIYGLYSSFIPMSMYLLFGTSHHINVAPVAVVSLLTNEAINAVVSFEQDPARYVQCATFLALLVGLFNLLFGVLNIGFLLRLLSPAFIAAFVCASAFTIGSTQLGNLFGIKVAGTSYIWQAIISLCEGIDQTKWFAFVMGFASLCIIIMFRHRYPKVPIAFIIMIVMTFISWTIQHFNAGFPVWPVTGAMPGGLPTALVPTISPDDITSLIAPAFVITCIGYMESYSLAVRIADKHGYKIRGSQEFIALGAANLVGSFFQAYPVTGSFSRTAEADLQNAKTILYTLVSIITVIISLLFLTPVFYYIPKSTLSSVVLAAVFRLIDFETPVKYYYCSTQDFIIWVFTFIGVIAGGTENGIAVGVGLSFVFLIHQHMFPYTALLGEFTGPDGKTLLLNTKRFPQAKEDPNIAIMRFDHSLVFLNRDYFADKVVRKTTAIVDQDDPYYPYAPRVTPKVFILDGSAIHHVDIFGAEELVTTARRLRKRGITPLFAYIRSNVKDVLIDSGLIDELNFRSIFHTVDSAVVAARQIVDGENPLAVLERNSEAVDKQDSSIATAAAAGADLEMQETSRSVLSV